MATISIVTSENVGGYEWRLDPVDAEHAFRVMRGLRGVTKLWHGVEVGDMAPGDIDDYVDSIYWGHAASLPEGDDGQAAQEMVWGKPARIHGQSSE